MKHWNKTLSERVDELLGVLDSDKENPAASALHHESANMRQTAGALVSASADYLAEASASPCTERVPAPADRCEAARLRGYEAARLQARTVPAAGGPPWSLRLRARWPAYGA